jgi:hypothetical protein
VDWTSQPVDEAKVKFLAQSASVHKLHYLFPFTTYRKSDGSFSSSYTYAADFVSQFRRFNQDARLLAWVGLPLQWTDLTDEKTRHEIVAFVAELIGQAGFNGVHLDAEPILDNNESYLLLLDDLRNALGRQYLVSIAGSHWVSPELARLPWVNDNQVSWNGDYYRAVAKRVDQIVMMTYDSEQTNAAIYRLWLREQVHGVDASLANLDTELLIGVSISQEDTESHQPLVENMQNGLAGLCDGILASQVTVADGAAIYASWEAYPIDWQIWDKWIATPLK